MTHKNLPIYIGTSNGFAESITIDHSLPLKTARRLTEDDVLATPPNPAIAYPQAMSSHIKNSIKIQGFGDTGLLSILQTGSHLGKLDLTIGAEAYEVYVDSYSFEADPNKTIRLSISATRLDTGVMAVPAVGGTPYGDFSFARGYTLTIADSNELLNNTTKLGYSQSNRWTYVYNTDGSAAAITNGAKKEVKFNSTGIYQTDFKSNEGILESGIDISFSAGPVVFSTTSSARVSQESWSTQETISVDTIITEEIY